MLSKKSSLNSASNITLTFFIKAQFSRCRSSKLSVANNSSPNVHVAQVLLEPANYLQILYCFKDSFCNLLTLILSEKSANSTRDHLIPYITIMVD